MAAFDFHTFDVPTVTYDDVAERFSQINADWEAAREHDQRVHAGMGQR